MSSPRISRPMAISGPSSSSGYKLPRRSSSSIRRPRQESISSSSIPYDPDTYTDDIIPQDVIFDGPSASSVPTSISNFAHRRSSVALDEQRFFAEEFDSDAEDVLTEVDSEEEDRHSFMSSRSEASSIAVMSTPDIERADQFPLIRRKSSDQRSWDVEDRHGGKATQRIYLADEDMVVVMSGFRTRRGRMWVLWCFMLFEFGVGLFGFEVVA